MTQAPPAPGKEKPAYRSIPTQTAYEGNYVLQFYRLPNKNGAIASRTTVFKVPNPDSGILAVIVTNSSISDNIFIIPRHTDNPAQDPELRELIYIHPVSADGVASSYYGYKGIVTREWLEPPPENAAQKAEYDADTKKQYMIFAKSAGSYTDNPKDKKGKRSLSQTLDQLVEAAHLRQWSNEHDRALIQGIKAALIGKEMDLKQIDERLSPEHDDLKTTREKRTEFSPPWL